MSQENIYESPKSDLKEVIPEQSMAFRVWRRFYISFLWSLPIYMFFVVFGIPKESWLIGAIGSVIFSIGTGLLATFIPSNRKAIFASISIIIGLISAFALGT